jgi:hypothetical protein
LGCVTTYRQSANVVTGCPLDTDLVLFTDDNNLSVFRAWSQIVACISAAQGLKPLIGVTGDGGPDDPVTDSSFFESSKLAGIGASNNNRFIIIIDGVILQNFGSNIGFTFDTNTNIIDISPNTFPAGSGLYIDLNQ